jgi:primosomal protein N' (replication factor Y)
MSGLFQQDERSIRQDAEGWHFVRVAVERGLDLIGRGRTHPRGESPGDGSLTYKSAIPLPIGRRVEVTLGRGNTESAGIVVEAGGVELAGGLDIDRIKPITRDTGAGLPPRIVELARWMAGYYVCPLGMVLATMMPAAVKKGTGLRVRVVLDRVGEEEAAGILAAATPKTREVWAKVGAIDASAFPVDLQRLAGLLEVKTVAPINRLTKLGLLRRIEQEVVAEFGGAALQGSLEQAMAATAGASGRLQLTNHQARIVKGIGEGLDRFGVHLIRGVTGSGKTEVYLRLMERVLEAGRNALMLVPEIALTPQTAGRFTERFGHLGPGAVAVLHSGLTASQRHKQWQMAARGREAGGARVVIGARSAVFAPLPDVGLIVVDEEHAGDYKQDQLPRYHGRDVAIKRAHLEGCPVVLGSATPSLESWVNAAGIAPGGTGAKPGEAATTGKYALWELTDRVGGGTLPPVEIVDLADERRLMREVHPKRDPWQDLIGPRLEHALRQTLDAGGQAILLLNRRGYSAYIACSDPKCGYRLQCDECDALMVHHRVLSTPGEAAATVVPRRAIVRCHHCLAQILMPERCPVCDKRLIRLGMGTQRLEEELADKFPDLVGAVGREEDEGVEASAATETMARVDGDTTKSGREWFDVLSRFARGELRVLMGTQMIAKGLDFPNVRLVGVVNADTALGLPDFRASERTFQLVSQVAGRAGRGALGGLVVVQTMEPGAPSIQFAAAHDYLGFAEAEMKIRRLAGLPPATRMARVVCRDRDHTKASGAATRLAEVLKAEIRDRGWEAALRIIGPGPAPIARIAGHHRFELLLIGKQRMAIQEVMAAARARGLLKSDAHTAVDVDPMALM